MTVKKRHKKIIAGTLIFVSALSLFIRISFASVTYDFEGGTISSDFDLTPQTPFAIATDQVHAGTYSIKSGNAAVDNSFAQITLLGDFASGGTATFWYRYDTEGSFDFLIFMIDGVVQTGFPKSGSGTTWTQFSTTTLPSGVHSLDWIYVKDHGTNTGGDAVWIDDIVVPDFTLVSDKGESFESGIPGTWTNDATEVWSSTNAVYRRKLGSNSARSYLTLGGSGVSTLQRTITTSAGDMFFYFYVSSEAGFDFLRFYIDGVEKTDVAASGVFDLTRNALHAGWNFRKYTVTAASHTFKWEYSKDGGGNIGDDAAYIDLAFFPTTPAAPGPIVNSSSFTIGNAKVTIPKGIFLIK
ncbi:MAG: hypothetical protein Q7S11_01230 [bacterium]|nr:hypothetical protein [bacterium]